MKRFCWLAVLAAGFGPTMAAAEGESGPYLALYGGLVIPQTTDIDYRSGGTAGSARIAFDTGFSAGVATGYDYGSLRFELDAAYHAFDASKLSDVTVNGIRFADVDDSQGGLDFDVIAVTANVLYQVPTGTAVTPYLGLGLGAMTVWGTVTDQLGFDYDGHDLAFAYQGIVGTQVALGSDLTGFIDYRYLGSSQISIGDFEFKARLHRLNAGLMFNL